MLKEIEREELVWEMVQVKRVRKYYLTSDGKKYSEYQLEIAERYEKKYQERKAVLEKLKDFIQEVQYNDEIGEYHNYCDIGFWYCDHIYLVNINEINRKAISEFFKKIYNETEIFNPYGDSLGTLDSIQDGQYKIGHFIWDNPNGADDYGLFLFEVKQNDSSN